MIRFTSLSNVTSHIEELLCLLPTDPHHFDLHRASSSLWVGLCRLGFADALLAERPDLTDRNSQVEFLDKVESAIVAYHAAWIEWLSVERVNSIRRYRDRDSTHLSCPAFNQAKTQLREVLAPVERNARQRRDLGL